jgi:uncharacterized protein YbbC (DUF1343 family)
VKLFSPEHGLSAGGADGQPIQDGRDTLTGLPVVSLYGPRLTPSREDLENLDLVLFDIPDLGCRFYTYLWTMTYVMEACASYNKLFVLADRPNPLSGDFGLAEGPLLEELSCSSFIGRWSIPVRHSCTLGELAIYFSATGKINGSPEVIPCKNWNRPMFYPDWASSFVPTSPAIPGFESALLYPGLCLLEATNLSEGRGTSTPFRVAGAPWMQAEKTATLFNKLVAGHAGSRESGKDAMDNGDQESVYARPVSFTPAEGKYASQMCEGVMLHIRDLRVFHPVRIGWLLIRLIKDLHPGLFGWATYPTQVNPSGKKHLDLLTGLPDAERLFESDPADMLSEIKKHTSASQWQDMVRPYLLYS